MKKLRSVLGIQAFNKHVLNKSMCEQFLGVIRRGAGSRRDKSDFCDRLVLDRINAGLGKYTVIPCSGLEAGKSMREK